MGTKEEQATLQLPDPDPDFDDLVQRLEKLSEQDRRRTMGRLSAKFDIGAVVVESTEEASGGQNPSNVTVRDRSQSRVVPSVTNVTVEHSGDKKLPKFSGRTPVPHGEVSFRNWYRAAERLVEDSALEEGSKKRILLRSLNDKADDIAELNRTKSVSEIVEVLSKNYGSMIDGEELLIEFYNLTQSKESASDFLSHLYVELGEVVKYGGLNVAEMDKKLLKQFIRGTSDTELLLKLRLEEKTNSPPSFPDLIQSVRKEEAERTARKLRLKKQVKMQAATAEPTELDGIRRHLERLENLVVGSQPSLEPVVSEPANDLAQINQRLAHMEQQFASRNFKQVRDDSNIFCYRCGIDKHVATACKNAPNKQLVQEKITARKRRNEGKNSKVLGQTGDVTNNQ